MERQLARLLFGASFFLLTVAFASGTDGKDGLTQVDLESAKAVAEALKSEISGANKLSARQFFLLGTKYQRRAVKDGNWAPAAKAFGESAILFPRPLALSQYAESSLKAASKTVLAKGKDAQLQLLKQTIDIYDSALAADDIQHELNPAQRAQLVQDRNCSKEYLLNQKPLAHCPPLQWLAVAVN